MSYSSTTEHFKIPVHRRKDKIEEADLRRIYAIIENQLIAGMKGVTTCVFEDGRYVVEENESGSYNVTLRSYAGKPALMGILNGGLVKSVKPIEWRGLENNKTHYLYVHGKEDLYFDSSAFTACSSTTPREFGVASYLCLAKVDLTGEESHIDTNPDGKVYSRDVALHASDITNPHGTHLHQDELTIREALHVSRMEDGLPVQETIWSQKDGFNSDLFGKRSAVVDTITKGEQGAKITIADAKQIFFVQVHEKVSPVETMFQVGAFAVGYHGEDGSIEEPNECRIYNSGKIDVPVRVMVWYE